LKEKKELSINYYGASDIGLVRTENQDCFGKFPKDNNDLYQPKGVLFIVADGMGGHTGGKEASQLAVNVVSSEYYSSTSDVIANALLFAFKSANLKIHQTSIDSPQFNKKGTTCSALVIVNDQAHIAHVGDSRIYKIADGNIIQFTNDHTEVGEMFRKGILSEKEAKNHPSKSVLVRAMGIEADIEVDLIENILLAYGDCFVLCSDGLAKVDTEEIKEAVLNNSTEEACKKLIALANERGGKDNVTVQVIKITGDNSEVVPETKYVAKKNNSKWFLISLLILFIVLLGLAGIFYQREIWNFFSKNKNNNTDTTKILNYSTPLDVVENTLKDANNYFSTGNLDTAAALYNLILNDNPLHIGALNGKEQVVLKYSQMGNQAIIDNKMEEALLYYKKAFALKPEDKELEIKIVSLKKNIRDFPPDVKKQIEIKGKEKSQEKIKQLQESENDPGLRDQITFSSMDVSEWDNGGLSGNDFKSNHSGFTFLNTNKSKKLIYKKEMADIDIEVDLQFDEHSFDKAGIIFGYIKTENNYSESFYLFKVDNSGNFSLLKFQNEKEELLLSGKRSIDLSKKIFKLKIKCLGPWIMMYNDNKLLETYLNTDFIKGRIGLYSEQNTHADFTDLKISSAFEKK
jgi:PPM family protein phosphatase